MATWTNEELDKTGAAEELEITPVRREGTLRNPVTIWVVRYGNRLYVRSYREQDGAWFQAAQVTHEGRIRAGGIEKKVRLVNAEDPDLNAQIDTAYRSQYGRYPQYVAPLVTPEARATNNRIDTVGDENGDIPPGFWVCERACHPGKDRQRHGSIECAWLCKRDH